MNAHLKQEQSAGVKNQRNGRTSKQLDTELGAISIRPPRDREGSFNQQLVGKWSRQPGTGLDRQILMMFAHGNSYGDIHVQLRQLYELEYSTASITEVTKQVWVEVEALHRQIRKVPKSKGSWANDKALLKQLYRILTYGRDG